MLCGEGQQDKKVCPRPYVRKYDSLELTAGNAIVVDEHIVAKPGKVLECASR
jgi:hypothetical protein